MPRHLILPKSAFKDVRSLVRLEEEKLRALGDLFGTSASIIPRSPEFIREVSDRLRLDIPTVESIILVCQFLLTVVEEGTPPPEILNDVREFVAQYASAEEKDVVSAFDAKRKILEAVLTPKPERSRALHFPPPPAAASAGPSGEENRSIPLGPSDGEPLPPLDPDAERLPSSEEAPPALEEQDHVDGLRDEGAPEASRSRNIAVAYEEVILAEEDAEILRRMREDTIFPVGRPIRQPRRMQDG